MTTDNPERDPWRKTDETTPDRDWRRLLYWKDENRIAIGLYVQKYNIWLGPEPEELGYVVFAKPPSHWRDLPSLPK